jgi:POT family proton-dependent oligopeptide transporter
MAQNNNLSHPKGLYFIFVTAMSERLSYYGMRAIFTLYLIKALLMDKESASMIYGNYTGLVYLTPLIGGYVADRYWGMRRSIFWGAIMMLFGQLLMFFSALYYYDGGMACWFMYTGLALLICGNGFFKPCVSSIVGQLYETNDKRLDSAYTIFYMGINLGAFIAPLICGWFGDTGNTADFKWGFLAATVGMSGSLILYILLKNKYLIDLKGAPLGVEAAGRMTKHNNTESTKFLKRSVTEMVIWGIIAAGSVVVFRYIANFDLIGAFIFTSCFIVPAFILTDRSLTKIERQRIWVIFIMAFFVIFFWSAYEQAGVSLTYFADEQTNRNIFGGTVPASFFQSFNALFTALLAPVISILWILLGKKNLDPASPTKQAVGLFLLSVGYLVIAIGVKDAVPGMKVSMLWLVGLFFIHSLGELALSPVGLSMVNKLSPVRFASLLMGIWYLANATANKFAGMLSGLYPEAGVTKHIFGIEIATLFDFFMLFVAMSGIASIILFLLSKTLQKMMNGVR